MSTQQIGQVGTLVWFVVLIGIFYLFLIRPQQTRVKKHQELIASLKKTDRVITMGGIHGTVVSVDEETITLEVAKDVVIKVSRSAISQRREE
ncbi:MAG: preprotein translocase subunit YajC [Candidatus Subteraquimicrobiales bacterium]|nr:preprotein translocase subunit YajC [Candidatus Subteraquimicrobiales bacterium]